MGQYNNMRQLKRLQSRLLRKESRKQKQKLFKLMEKEEEKDGEQPPNEKASKSASDTYEFPWHLWSAGSLKHLGGCCKPFPNLPIWGFCTDAEACEFCHLCPWVHPETFEVQNSLNSWLKDAAPLSRTNLE